MWFLSNVIFELILYLIVDNITKFVISNHRNQNRFDILINECVVLGFLIGFVSIYHHITYTLIVILFIHIIGTFYTEKRFNLIPRGIKKLFSIYIEIFYTIITRLYQFISNRFVRRSPSTIMVTKQLPQKYSYSYHLKPTNDLRLQQPSFVQTLPRPGIFNVHGTTCSLNALLQSLASLNSFYTLLQRNINLSRSTYDSIVPSFLGLISQLRNDYHTSEYKHCNIVVDTSVFISRLNLIHPNVLTKHLTTDIAELFQCIIDVLNNALSKQTSICSTNVIEQVQNQKLTTFSLDYLNKIFLETEAQLYNKITLDNLDAQASYIIQYIDLTWLLHHIQQGSIIKHTFSGQLLHAHCCDKCSHIRFRAEPFQVLTLPVNNKNTTLEKLISQLTQIERIDSISCSYCSSQISNETEVNGHGTFLNKIASTLTPLVTRRLQPSGQLLPRPASTTVIINHKHSKIKSQTMIANFPNILCIQLKRFSYDRISSTTTKLNTRVLIEPEQILDLSHVHYTTWLGLTNLSINIPSRYRLIAVCLHLSRNSSSVLTNSTISGHYVCLYRTDHSRWFLSDDERISEINQSDQVFQTPYVTENCYLLFYERCS